MLNAPQATFTLYFSSLLTLTAGFKLGAPEERERARSPLARAQARGELSPGVPHLDRRDAMANSAVLMAALADLPATAEGDGGCGASPRTFTLLLDGRRSRVRFPAFAVCQLRALKRISIAQPGFGHRGLGELAAFVLGVRSVRFDGEPPEEPDDVDVSRIVVPPFRFTGETVNFVDADLGPLGPGERFLGTYHTHPEGDLEQGVLSPVDLAFMRTGRADFHGRLGSLRVPGPDLDWLFDIVETRDGDWNVYAHDRPRYEELLERCGRGASGACPVGELRLAGSRFHLLVRYFDGGQE